MWLKRLFIVTAEVRVTQQATGNNALTQPTDCRLLIIATIYNFSQPECGIRGFLKGTTIAFIRKNDRLRLTPPPLTR